MAGTCLKNYSPRQLEELMVSRGESSFRGRQIARWLYGHGVRSIDAMTNLSHSFRKVLSAEFSLEVFHSYEQKTGRDGSSKFAFALDDGAVVEGVAMPESDHITYCLSTQVGCPLDCRFCLTGKLGYRRNLEPAEIIEQYLIMRSASVGTITTSNVVLMGMGEPLLNYEAVSTFLETAIDDNGLGLSTRRVTVSTVGIPKVLERFGRDWPMIQLAVSLNASDQSLREQLMPVSRGYKLDELILTLRTYPLPNRRRITIEYVLLAGVNDGDQQARQLASLLRGIRCKVNVIPYNENEGLSFRRPSEERIDRFGQILRDCNLTVMIRRSRGVDIAAACGQLGRKSDVSTTEN